MKNAFNSFATKAMKVVAGLAIVSAISQGCTRYLTPEQAANNPGRCRGHVIR